MDQSGCGRESGFHGSGKRLEKRGLGRNGRKRRKEGVRMGRGGGGGEPESQGNGVNRERGRMGWEWDSGPEAQGGKGQDGWHSDWASRRPEQ